MKIDKILWHCRVEKARRSTSRGTTLRSALGCLRMPTQ